MKNKLYNDMMNEYNKYGCNSGTVKDWNFKFWVEDKNHIKYQEELFVELMNEGLLKRFAVFDNPIYCYELTQISHI
jgi:hypothetical protein